MRLRIIAGTLAIIAIGAVRYHYWSGRARLAAKEADARTRLAFESLSDRLPKGSPIPPSNRLSPEAQNRWEVRNEQFTLAVNERSQFLKAFHDRTQRFFVESPDFGAGRRFTLTPDEVLVSDWLDNDPPKQPGVSANFPLSEGEPVSRIEPADEFFEFQNAAIFSFLNPYGFGYVKDRRQVSGFKPHGFRVFHDHPCRDPPHRWRVANIDLIGILMHPEPIVYLTDKMPSMEQIRHGKTRPLDLFESAGMPSLREGEDLYIVRKENTLRMLGAIRATKICQQCHDAEIGDMLGAFSYTLKSAESPESDKR